MLELAQQMSQALSMRGTTFAWQNRSPDFPASGLFGSINVINLPD